MPKFEKADAVAEKVAKRLGDEPWLEGVGVDFDDDEQYVVSVRVSKDPGEVALPGRIDGVRVKIIRRARARAR